MTYRTTRNQTTLEDTSGVLTSREFFRRTVRSQTLETDRLGVAKTELEQPKAAEYLADATLMPTSVTAGIPGTFGSNPIPYDLAELRALGAIGETTAWTVGQYVVLGDGSSAYWDGDSWEAGTAPA